MKPIRNQSFDHFELEYELEEERISKFDEILKELQKDELDLDSVRSWGGDDEFAPYPLRDGGSE